MSLAIEAFVDNVKRFCDWAESACHGLDTARHVLLALIQGVFISSDWRSFSVNRNGVRMQRLRTMDR